MPGVGTTVTGRSTNRVTPLAVPVTRTRWDPTAANVVSIRAVICHVEP
ncbi:MAG: hypothetical protein ABR576_11870 [Thermoanaerobaculia bacterium]